MRWTFALSLLLFGATTTMAQGIDFFHGDWEEALEKAKNEEKIIFVDAYTTWCGPCKRMAKSVFPDPGVGEFYNEHFVSMKINMESSEGTAFMAKYPVTAYPTLYFIDGNGKVVLHTKGARKADQFIELGRSALAKQDNSQAYAEAYEKGDRDPELVYKYVRALNKAGKPSLKIANEYLATQKDLTTDQNLRFILEATTEADSRIFDLLVKHKAQIVALSSAEQVQKKMESACIRTSKKAIEYQSEDLHHEARAKLIKYGGKHGSAMAYSADMRFYSAVGDVKNYLKACNTYVKKEAGSDASKLYEVVQNIQASFPTDGKAMSQAEKWAKKTALNGGLFKYYFSYATILYKNGKKSEALKIARKTLELADQQNRRPVEMLIERIEAAG